MNQSNSKYDVALCTVYPYAVILTVCTYVMVLRDGSLSAKTRMVLSLFTPAAYAPVCS